MAGLVATRSFERSPSHLSDTTRLSSDDLDGGGGARDDESTRRSTPGPRDDERPSTEVEEVEDLLASLRVAPYQVAGHSSKGVGLPSLVDIDVGHFLKPAPDDRKGVAELSFYERVARAAASGTGAPAFDDDELEGGKNVTTSAPPVSHGRDAIAGIAPFVPTFHGVLTVDPSTLVSVAGDDPTAAAARDAASKGTRATFLRLEDVTAVRIFVYLFMSIIPWHVWAIELINSCFVYLSSQGYRRPCVIDLKVGLRTYSERGHDSAYVAKRSAHDKRSGQFEVGFKVCGMQTWERSLSMGSDENENGKNSGEGSSPENSGGVNFKRLKAARSDTKAYPDGWTRVTKPYSWARGLCSKSDARKALEEFVGMDSDDDDEDAQLCFLNDGGNGDASSAHSGDSHSNGDSSNEGPSCSSYDGGSKNERSDARHHPSRGTKSGGCDCGDSKLRRKTNRAKEVYGEALSQIGAMRAWFATQRELHLLGSSVLIVYEGDERMGEGNDDTQLCHRSGPGVRVKAIDFCNYVEGAGELDTNFGAGLDRLSRMLESIVADS